MVACNNDWSPTTSISCFGYCSRDTGQSRVPDPPARMTCTSRRVSVTDSATAMATFCSSARMLRLPTSTPCIAACPFYCSNEVQRTRDRFLTTHLALRANLSDVGAGLWWWPQIAPAANRERSTSDRPARDVLAALQDGWKDRRVGPARGHDVQFDR